MDKYQQQRKEMVHYGYSLYQRGHATGGAGNLSIKLNENLILATPTGACLGELTESTLSLVTLDGEWIDGNKPSKEVDFHRAIYKTKPSYQGIVHLHSTYLTALSCQTNLDKSNALQAFTPYYVMRVGALPSIPYFRPGHPSIADHLCRLAGNHKAILMANHGVTVMGNSFKEAIYNFEELEETAKLSFILPAANTRYLSKNEVSELKTGD
ncbi:aldolase [Vibrio sonorensis]|uniref:3-oxo-tetronate 4-phosphate decarboxylase n=1 Tax=Vibrio sonorensis TaxID=1004316 RepID=UPI000B1383F9|nr:aldolase [Vibrio sonorensis]